MIDFLSKGGVLVIPILLCSVLALAIFLERIIRFSRLRSRGAGLAEKTVDLLHDDKADEAIALVDSSNSPMGRVLARALEVKDQDRETVERRSSLTVPKRKSGSSPAIFRHWRPSVTLHRCSVCWVL